MFTQVISSFFSGYIATLWQRSMSRKFQSYVFYVLCDILQSDVSTGLAIVLFFALPRLHSPKMFLAEHFEMHDMFKPTCMLYFNTSND